MYNYKFLLRLLLFWMLVFCINRIVFLFAVVHLLGGVPFSEIVYALVAALLLDLSTASYFILTSVAFILIYSITEKTFLIKCCHALNYFFIFLISLISFGEISLYQEWRTKLNIQALLHFENPIEVFSSASWTLVLLFIIPLVLFTFVYIKVYRKIVKPYFITTNTQEIKKKITNVLLCFALLPVLFVFIRGGFQRFPISESDPIYSKHQSLNDAAINSTRFLIKDIIDYTYSLRENPTQYMDEEKAKSILADFYKTKKDTTEIILTTQRPNIIFILLESWSANLVKSYGGDNFTPFFDSLAEEGIKFTNFYPSGYISDQGIPAILSAYPASFKISVINHPEKIPSLPCINTDLKNAGYSSSFIYAGDLNFGNLKGYIFNKNFDVIKQEFDFNKSLPRGSLGIHDQTIVPEVVNIINQSDQPFFACWYTLSSHSPYDFPREKSAGDANDYEQSVQYTDAALRKFFNEAKTQPWFNNTLFVLVADHSHNSRKNYDLVKKEYHRIPMLFYGNVIKPEWRNKEIKSAFSHLDIVPTLLKQLGLSTENYSWGKNMFNPYSPHFAYYCYYYGAGMVTDSAYVSLHRELSSPIDFTGKDTNEVKKLTQQLKAFQQVFYDDFLAR